MPMKIEILELAEKELEDAVLYYELEQDGLGRKFRDAVRHSIERIKRYPTSWPIERSEVRKFFVQNFRTRFFIQCKNKQSLYWQLLINIENRDIG